MNARGLKHSLAAEANANNGKNSAEVEENEARSFAGGCGMKNDKREEWNGDEREMINETK